MQAVCPSVHLPELVYGTAHHAVSGLAALGLPLGAGRGGARGYACPPLPGGWSGASLRARG